MRPPTKPWRWLALLGWLACDSGARKPAAATSDSAPSAPTPAAAAPVPSPAAPKAPPVPQPASDARANGPAGCRFEQPASWTSGQVSWLGGCHDGFAGGNGVLVDTVQGEEPERFYGLLADGRLKLGVLQTSGGLQAGTWDQGALAAPLPDDVAQRNAVIAAFRAASAAATSASKLLAKSPAKKDAKSSRFYAKQARQLREQMD